MAKNQLYTMKNTIKILQLAMVFGVLGAALISAAPASATTVAGYYDQFGNYHFYQTYEYPGTSYGYNQYGYSNTNGLYNVRPTNYSNSFTSCPAGYVYNSFNAVCAPVNQQAGSVATTFSNGLAATTKTTGTTGSKATGSGVSGSTGQASALSSLFGGKDTGPLAISNVTVVSGPKNITDESAETNCSVLVSWTTNVASAGQVVYGQTSQPKIDSFNYPSVVAEGTSYQKQHQVKLGCLANSTYYFRVIAFSKSERAVSDEQTIFPIKVRGQVPVLGSTSGSSSGGASAFGTVASILMSPVVLTILIILAVAYIVMKILRKGGSSGASHGAHAPVHAEPALEIPHH